MKKKHCVVLINMLNNNIPSGMSFNSYNETGHRKYKSTTFLLVLYYWKALLILLFIISDNKIIIFLSGIFAESDILRVIVLRWIGNQQQVVDTPSPTQAALIHGIGDRGVHALPLRPLSRQALQPQLRQPTAILTQ